MSFMLYNKSCYGLSDINTNSIDCVITDPPYGIDLEHWDKMPMPSIWNDCYRVLKPGGFLLCFTSIQYQHLFTNDIMDAGFNFKDVLLWIYLNGRVPPIDLDKKIDKHLGQERNVIGHYDYVQGSPNSKKKQTYKTKNIKLGNGFYFGLAITLIFIMRILIEFVKINQVEFEEGMKLNMGQILSIPFIIIGIYFIAKNLKPKETE